MNFLESIKQRAKNHCKKILLPESGDERVLRAASICQKEGLAKIVLLGDEKQIAIKLRSLGLKLGEIEVIDPQEKVKLAELAELGMSLREGISEEEALKQLKNPLCYGALSLRHKQVQGMVSGACHNSSEVIRAALHYIPKISTDTIISGMFLAFLPSDLGEKGLLGLADCAVNTNPNLRQLVQITTSSINTLKHLCGVDAKVAMLSFSTKGSAEHKLTKKMVEATIQMRALNPALIIDGELQLDTAIIPKIAKIKAPMSPIRGNANLLIFPDLNSGNIGYKLIQRIGNAQVIGPILQGLTQPFNDLSRGCELLEIVYMVCVTSLQAEVASA